MLRFDFSQIKANLVQGSSYGFRTKKNEFLEPRTKNHRSRGQIGIVKSILYKKNPADPKNLQN